MSDSDQVENSFHEFYRKWVYRLKLYLPLLIDTAKLSQTIEEQELKKIISILSTHFESYYTAKWAAVDKDVLQFFLPPWRNSLEAPHLCVWITGWKPSLMFPLAGLKEEDNLSELQVKKVEELRAKTITDEEKVDEEMKIVEMILGDKNMAALTQWAKEAENESHSDSVLGSRETRHTDEAMEMFLGRCTETLAKVVKSADDVRLEFLKCVIEIANPSQCIHFLSWMCLFEVTKMEKSEFVFV